MLGEILDEVVTAIRAGHYRPLPVTSYSTSEVASAFRDMAAGQHFGKIIVRVERERRSSARRHQPAPIGRVACISLSVAPAGWVWRLPVG